MVGSPSLAYSSLRAARGLHPSFSMSQCATHMTPEQQPMMCPSHAQDFQQQEQNYETQQSLRRRVNCVTVTMFFVALFAAASVAVCVMLLIQTKEISLQMVHMEKQLEHLHPDVYKNYGRNGTNGSLAVPPAGELPLEGSGIYLKPPEGKDGLINFSLSSPGMPPSASGSSTTPPREASRKLSPKVLPTAPSPPVHPMGSAANALPVDDEDNEENFEGSGSGDSDCPHYARPICPSDITVCYTKDECPVPICCLGSSMTQ